MTPIDRRDLLRQALFLVGAATLPAGGFELLAAPPAATSRILEPKRFALLTAVADTIVPRTETPGAVDAGVPALFDAMLREWASPKRRDDLIAALDAIDRLPGKDATGGFAALAPDRRYTLLDAHDTAALKKLPVAGDAAAAPLKAAPAIADPNYGKIKQEPAPTVAAGAPSPAVVGGKEVRTKKKKGLAAMMAEPAVVDPAYAKLKELIVTLYYLSEAALTKELPYEQVPGEWIPSTPVTAGTRPWGGAALT